MAQPQKVALAHLCSAVLRREPAGDRSPELGLLLRGRSVDGSSSTRGDADCIVESVVRDVRAPQKGADFVERAAARSRPKDFRTSLSVEEHMVSMTDTLGSGTRPTLANMPSHWTGSSSAPLVEQTAGGPTRAVAAYDYGEAEDSQPGDLTFAKGEELIVLTDDHPGSGWWTGAIGARKGIFPANFVKLLPEAESSTPLLTSPSLQAPTHFVCDRKILMRSGVDRFTAPCGECVKGCVLTVLEAVADPGASGSRRLRVKVECAGFSGQFYDQSKQIESMKSLGVHEPVVGDTRSASGWVSERAARSGNALVSPCGRNGSPHTVQLLAPAESPSVVLSQVGERLTVSDSLKADVDAPQTRTFKAKHDGGRVHVTIKGMGVELTKSNGADGRTSLGLFYYVDMLSWNARRAPHNKFSLSLRDGREIAVETDEAENMAALCLKHAQRFAQKKREARKQGPGAYRLKQSVPLRTGPETGGLSCGAYEAGTDITTLNTALFAARVYMAVWRA